MASQGDNNDEVRIGEEEEEEEDQEEFVGLEMEEGAGDSSFSNDEPAEEIRDRFGAYAEVRAPIDDVCPICFDGFILPCRSNCGHWFCASCIIQLWMFRSSIQPCKCPLCYSRIVNLKPEAHPPPFPPTAAAAGYDTNALKKVHHYNGLYSTGSPALRAFHRIRSIPILLKRAFRVLLYPDALRCTYYILRLLGLFFALLYERWEFEFVPSGGLGIRRMFDTGATIIVVTLFLGSVGYPWLFRHININI
ncbi:uncharacterized protein LOC127262007 [Andrographis paniculata]|uniref:uncharacterized protein LOC127262007 n=1 Tax=Andrographis paniculata TaxID=175694 RepID=UPI0021E82C89|nr:uncharacterized protein LOC127262007 [Andrographis paniculata]